MSEIERYYRSGIEGARLRTGNGKLELARVQELLVRFLPEAPATVYDVGGGTISRFASALDGIREGYLADPEFAAMVDRDLADGHHTNPTGKPEYFMDTDFHHPDELAGEIAKAGFVSDGVLGIEGPGWLAHDFEAWWGDSYRRERLLHLARRLESEPALAGLSAHLLAAARKP